MENSSPYREGLPLTISSSSSYSSSSSSKADRRWRSSKPLQTSKPSIVMTFFSCLAWLYIAGMSIFISYIDIYIDIIVFFFLMIVQCSYFAFFRLWQDAENRNLLANLLKKNADQFFFFYFVFI